MRLTTSPSNFIRFLIVLLAIALCSLALDAQVTAPPWSAPPSTIVVAEERDFQKSEVKLSGTLYMPTATKPVPVVIAFHSASSATQDLPLYYYMQVQRGKSNSTRCLTVEQIFPALTLNI